MTKAALFLLPWICTQGAAAVAALWVSHKLPRASGFGKLELTALGIGATYGLISGVGGELVLRLRGLREWTWAPATALAAIAGICALPVLVKYGVSPLQWATTLALAFGLLLGVPQALVLRHAGLRLWHLWVAASGGGLVLALLIGRVAEGLREWSPVPIFGVSGLFTGAALLWLTSQVRPSARTVESRTPALPKH